MLQTTIYDLTGEVEQLDVESTYVSFINGNSFGPPPLIAPASQGHGKGAEVNVKAAVGESVLYVNTSLVPLALVTRLED